MVRTWLMRVSGPLVAMLIVACTAAPATPTPVPSPTPSPVPTATPLPDELRLLPEAPAPAGLHADLLPAESAGIVALLERLPSEVAGKPLTAPVGRQEGGAFEVGYGEPMAAVEREIYFRVLDVTTGEFFENVSSAGEVVHTFSEGPDWEVVDFGQDGLLAWVRWTSTATSGTETVSVHSITWANVDSVWLFGAIARTPEQALAMTSAFVRTAEGAP